MPSTLFQPPIHSTLYHTVYPRLDKLLSFFREDILHEKKAPQQCLRFRDWRIFSILLTCWSMIDAQSRSQDFTLCPLLLGLKIKFPPHSSSISVEETYIKKSISKKNKNKTTTNLCLSNFFKLLFCLHLCNTFGMSFFHSLFSCELYITFNAHSNITFMKIYDRIVTASLSSSNWIKLLVFIPSKVMDDLLVNPI